MRKARQSHSFRCRGAGLALFWTVVCVAVGDAAQAGRVVDVLYHRELDLVRESEPVRQLQARSAQQWREMESGLQDLLLDMGIALSNRPVVSAGPTGVPVAVQLDRVLEEFALYRKEMEGRLEQSARELRAVKRENLELATERNKWKTGHEEKVLEVAELTRKLSTEARTVDAQATAHIQQLEADLAAKVEDLEKVRGLYDATLQRIDSLEEEILEKEKLLAIQMRYRDERIVELETQRDDAFLEVAQFEVLQLEVEAEREKLRERVRNLETELASAREIEYQLANARSEISFLRHQLDGFLDTGDWQIKELKPDHVEVSAKVIDGMGGIDKSGKSGVKR